MVPVVVDGEAVLSRDEGEPARIHAAEAGQPQTTFRPDGCITVGNASPLSDGASAVL
ncbi:hypothetical protein ACFY0P_44745 [Streptomyces sp. NPDC001714]|uniref:thiolase family protein n=1 Tax=Streptomyces sp. NPDC001714 TaxID=3364603 RepID=UPI0036AA1276